MSQLTTVLRWRWRASWQQFGEDGRSPMALLFFLIINIGLFVWGRRALQSQLVGLSGVMLTAQLWRLLAGLLLGIALFSLFKTIQTCLAAPETALLLTQPVSPRQYWWILFGEVFGTAVLPWLIVLTSLLYWVLSQLDGVAAWLWCAWLFSAALLLTMIVMVALAAILSQKWLGLLFAFMGITSLAVGPWLTVSRAFIVNLFLLVSSLFVAPLWGTILAEAYREAAKFSGRPFWLKVPARYSLTHRLLRWRSPFAALLVKEIRSQSRNWLSWGRIIALGVYLTFIPALQRFLQGLDATQETQIIIPAVLFGLGVVLEYSPYAFSGEGNRFTLWLVAPLKTAVILRGRLLIYLLPALAAAFCLAGILAWQTNLRFNELASVMAAIVLFLLLTQIIYVWGSSWDLDIDMPVEGFIQTLLIEEAPINQKRLLLVIMGLIVFAGVCWLLLRFQLTTVIFLLLLLNAITFLTGQRFARVHLEP